MLFKFNVFQTGSTITTQPSTLPDDGVLNPHLRRTLLLSYRQRKPVFLMKRVTRSECEDLQTDSCGMIASRTNCSAIRRGLFANCYSLFNYEVAVFNDMIAQLNASRGLDLYLQGTRTFPACVFTPVKDVLVSLNIRYFPAIKLSSFRSAAGNFPVMQDLTLSQCSSIEILRTDLQVFPALRVFYMGSGSTVRSIEPRSFDSLPYLRHINFEHGFDTNKPLPQSALDHLRLLHCDPLYKWLRVFLRERPYLIAPKEEGEIFDVGGLVNKASLKKDIFIPVDCLSESLVGGVGFSKFSSLDEWCKHTLVYWI